MAGILLGLALGILGAVVGYAVGSDRSSEGQTSLLIGAEVAASAPPPGESVEAQVTADPGSDDGGAEPKQGIDLGEATAQLRAELESTESELEALATQRDNLAEHNQLLQTWFTPAIVARSQQEWDAEVARVCGLVVEGATLDNSLLNYVRSLEVIGTVTDLSNAVEACVNG